MRQYLIIFFTLVVFCGCQKNAQQTSKGQAINEQVSPVKVASGKVIRVENFTAKNIASRNVDIWLPEGYSKTEKYATLYMHDGQMLFDASTTWNKQEWAVDEVVSKLIKDGTIRQCIVVGVWNSDKTRHSDYFPQKPFESLPTTTQDSLLKLYRNTSRPLFAAKVQSDHYLKFLVEELKPYIDANFSTLTDANHTFIAGSSMGGLISMYAICEYPQVFGGAACISTHWVGTFTNQNNPIPQAFIKYLSKHLPAPGFHKIYFDHGDATLDSLYASHQQKVDQVMIKKGYTASHWITKVFPGENHSENAWRKRLHIPLKFLLSK